MADYTRLSAIRWTIYREQEEWWVWACLSYAHYDNPVCHYSLMSAYYPWRILYPKTEDKSIKKPISMMAATHIWMILSSSVYLHKMWPSGQRVSKWLLAAAPAFTKLRALVCFCWQGVHNFRETTAAFASKQLSKKPPSTSCQHTLTHSVQPLNLQIQSKADPLGGC